MDFRTCTCAATMVAVLLGSASCAEGTPTAASPTTPSAAPVTSPEEPRQGDDYGTIDIYCNPPTPVLVDGKPAGTTPIKAFKVEPGKHDVTFTDEETGSRTMEVTVASGEGTSVTSDRPIRAREHDMPGGSGKAPPKKK